jgi:hypothetical protein
MEATDMEAVHTGACHCKAVTFQVLAPRDLTAWECNCSICRLRRNTHFIVPANKFQLLTGADSLSTYTFGTRVAQHMFCKSCGITTHYVPRSNPDGIAVTIMALAPGTVHTMTIRRFDGEHWDAAFKATNIASQTASTTATTWHT